jgi:hypothetical protein
MRTEIARRIALSITLALVAASSGVAISWARAAEKRRPPTPPTDVADAKAPPRPAHSGSPSAEGAVLWKYIARCALGEGQSLEGPDGVELKGGVGVAPEWVSGSCDVACQERVSACIFALTNPTGQHVQLSLLSAAPGAPASLAPGDADRDFAYQEGAFYGNLFNGEAYVCRGADSDQGPERKRWCAFAPERCSGAIARFVDAGSCADACDMSCTRLSDGTERCAAKRCRDPQGHEWSFPITTHLRGKGATGEGRPTKPARLSTARGSKHTKGR